LGGLIRGIVEEYGASIVGRYSVYKIPPEARENNTNNTNYPTYLSRVGWIDPYSDYLLLLQLQLLLV